MVDYNNLGKKVFKSTFLRFTETNPITGQFLSLEVVDNPFKKTAKDPDKALRYTLLVDGEEKTLTTGSQRLYNAFKKAKVAENDIVTIERIGMGRDTDYEVVVKTSEA